MGSGSVVNSSAPRLIFYKKSPSFLFFTFIYIHLYVFLYTTLVRRILLEVVLEVTSRTRHLNYLKKI